MCGIFFLDMVINFFTAKFNIMTGEELITHKQIARDYILSVRFFTDILSSIPFDKFGSSDFLQLFGMFRMVRLSRLSSMIDNLNVKSNKKAVTHFHIIVFIVA